MLQYCRKLVKLWSPIIWPKSWRYQIFIIIFEQFSKLQRCRIHIDGAMTSKFGTICRRHWHDAATSMFTTTFHQLSTWHRNRNVVKIFDQHPMLLRHLCDVEYLPEILTNFTTSHQCQNYVKIGQWHNNQISTLWWTFSWRFVPTGIPPTHF